MAMQPQPQLQWNLDKTANQAFIIARSILEAATRDNVQVLPITACQNFGATLAMSINTCDIVERVVLPTDKPALIRFLQVFIGYYPDDCASAIALGKNRAGIQFLGLACALTGTIPSYEGAAALEAMLMATATDSKLVPRRTHLKELLLSLEPRCHRSGFADSAIRYQTLIDNALFVPSSDSLEHGQKLRAAPSQEAIKILVDAFRELGRVGEATTIGAEIEVTKCAPWVAAFTEWCLEAPSLYYEDEDRIRWPIRQPRSKICIIIPNVAHDSDSPLKITIMREVGAPQELVAHSKGEEWMGMVSIEAYGQWLLHDYDFDRGPGSRALHCALPHAISKVLSSLTFRNFTTAQKWPDDGSPTERVGYVSDRLLDLCPRPFPDLRVIAHIYARVLNIEKPPDICSRGESLLVEDLPEIKVYLERLQRLCTCLQCRPLNRDMDDESCTATCEKKLFFYRIATIIADILTLSLFNLPDKLLVKMARRRYRQEREGFFSDIFAILLYGNESECDVRAILTSARMIVGHTDLDKELDSLHPDWVLTCSKGQAVYPAVFDSPYHIEKRGYLVLNWHPGVLQYSGEKWNGVVGCQTTWSSDQTDGISPQESLSPQNLFGNLKTKWVISTRDKGILEAKLLLVDGKRVSQTTRNPIDSVLGLQYGLIAEECDHNSDANLETPDLFCTYVGPEAVPSFRSPGSVVVVPVKDADDLRFFSIPGGEESRAFVLRKDACLSCCLKVCRKTDISLLIL